jgi:hypothetical protein
LICVLLAPPADSGGTARQYRPVSTDVTSTEVPALRGAPGASEELVTVNCSLGAMPLLLLPLTQYTGLLTLSTRQMPPEPKL